MAVPVRRDLAAALASLEDRRQRALQRRFTEARNRLTTQSRLLPDPDFLLQAPRQRLDRAAEGLPRGLRALVGARRLQLARGAGGRFGPALLRHRLALQQGRLHDRGGRLLPALRRALAVAQAQARPVLARLSPRLVRPAAARAAQATALLGQRLERVRRVRLDTAGERLARAVRLLEGLSYRATLARGFAVVRAEGVVATRAAQVAPGAALSLTFSDGEVAAVAGGAPQPKNRPKGPSGQGSLF
jgi:exodeoxyribonuclease VII large subunit